MQYIPARLFLRDRAAASWKARLVGRADLHNPLTAARYSQQRGTANRSQFLAQLAQFFQVYRLPTLEWCHVSCNTEQMDRKSLHLKLSLFYHISLWRFLHNADLITYLVVSISASVDQNVIHIALLSTWGRSTLGYGQQKVSDIVHTIYKQV